MRTWVVSVVVVLLLNGCNCGEVMSPDGGTASDASVADAGVADAGVADAGAPDAGVDAGQLPPCDVPVDETADATLYLAIDDEGTLFLNGAAIATQAIPWNQPLVRTLKINRNPRVPNVVAIEARNVFKQSGLDRAALADFRFGTRGQADAGQIFASGSGWRVLLAEDAGVADAGWTSVDFDDSSWGASVSVLPYGGSPYGNIFAQFGINTVGASWMWAYDPAPVPVATKPALEPIYFRRVFFFALDGGISADAGACSN
jgi:uncharacterized protein YceK